MHITNNMSYMKLLKQTIAYIQANIQHLKQGIEGCNPSVLNWHTHTSSAIEGCNPSVLYWHIHTSSAIEGCNPSIFGGRRDHDRMVMDLKLPIEISVYHHQGCEFEFRSGRCVQHYVIKFVSDLRQVGGFLRVLRFPPPINLTATI